MPEASPSSKKTCTIERVPDIIRGANESVYTPQLLSIGPYHKPKPNKPCPNLEKMEPIKLQYMNALFLRNRERSNLASEIKREMMEIEESVRSCYTEVETMDNEEFVRMMMLDGCFIIQLFLNMEYADADEDDPILRTRWMLPILSVDLLMLENQIPFVVLERIYLLVIGASTGMRSLKDVAFDFFKHLIPMNDDMPDGPPYVVDHLLHLCLLHIIPFHPTPTPTPTSVNQETTGYQPLADTDPNDSHTISPAAMMDYRVPPPSFIPPASEIEYRGIRLGRKENTSVIDVELTGKVLKIPTLSLNSASLGIFQNLVALEQCFQKYGSHCTAYANLMKQLIHSPEDVAILERHKVFEHSSGSDEELAQLFDKICKGVSPHLKESYLSELYKEVNKFEETMTRIVVVQINRKLFDSPWIVIELMFTLIAVGLTIFNLIFK